MLLAVDVGNSNVAVGVYRKSELLERWRLATRREATADDLGISMRSLFATNGVEPDDLQAIVYASVVPPLDDAFEKMFQRYVGLEPLQIEPGVKTGVDVQYDNPREVGADRIANAAATQVRSGGPAVVVDFGTATTFDILSSEDRYVGGIIMPGVGISSEALFHRAARLPRVDLYSPDRAVGRNTSESMRSGIVHGHAGAVDAVVDKIQGEIGPLRQVIATGGWAGVIAPECRSVHEIDPNLTLEGLRIIYMRNQRT